MSDEHEFVEAYMDDRAKSPHNDETREKFRQILTKRFVKNLPAAVERIWELPCLNIKSPSKPYFDLLFEARELFVDGRFYSCVAMCGIVGERLIKDVLRTSVLIEKDGQRKHPDEKAFDQLERVEVFGIVSFLKETGLLSEDAAKAAKNLLELRNTYAHARGKDPKKDAIDAIKYLHAIVEGTVSVFKDFDLKGGALLIKDFEIKDGALRGKIARSK